MEEFNNNYRRKRSKWARMWLMIGRLKLSIIFIVILVAIIASAYLVRSCRGNEATVYVDDKIDITPTQVLAMKEIGEWEFLSIENEEMIDTVRKGFFKDDELIRIYYGTLRLGFDMSEAKSDWIKADKDTLVITLPKIKLLDENFIDEARTKSFFESGSWSDKDRADMYKRAYAKMKARCLTKENIESAQDNAKRQFTQMLKAMGFEHVNISFEGSQTR